MTIKNFQKQINQYLKANRHLNINEIGTLLMIENMYSGHLPDDIGLFRNRYEHLNPEIINKTSSGITFLKLIKDNGNETVLKNKLNDYINIKYNAVGKPKSYDENMLQFRKHTKIISTFLDQILDIAQFNQTIKDVLRESPEVKRCSDFYELLLLYKSTGKHRIKFEIHRKIGLIVLLSRINRTFAIDDVDYITRKVRDAFRANLGLTPLGNKIFYFFINEHDKLSFSENKTFAQTAFYASAQIRKDLAMEIFPLQEAEFNCFLTKNGLKIMDIAIRNKFRKQGRLNYSSILEKIVRKNLEFPNQVHDITGLRLVVGSENEMPAIIDSLESFLGGSSTRKKEKNTFGLFDKRRLGRYSSKDYFVWKAIYDMALTHPSIEKVGSIIELARGLGPVEHALQKRLDYFIRHPRDYVIEVQLQDVNSYLLSITKGYSANHELLKTNQVRSNSFFKLFPKEIFEPEVKELKRKIINNYF